MLSKKITFCHLINVPIKKLYNSNLSICHFSNQKRTNALHLETDTISETRPPKDTSKKELNRHEKPHMKEAIKSIHSSNVMPFEMMNNEYSGLVEPHNGGLSKEQISIQNEVLVQPSQENTIPNGGQPINIQHPPTISHKTEESSLYPPNSNSKPSDTTPDMPRFSTSSSNISSNPMNMPHPPTVNSSPSNMPHPPTIDSSCSEFEYLTNCIEVSSDTGGCDILVITLPWVTVISYTTMNSVMQSSEVGEFEYMTDCIEAYYRIEISSAIVLYDGGQ